MIALIQRTLGASVTADGVLTGKIEKGLTIFLGVMANDGEKECEYLAKKTAALRVFSDENDKMNLSVVDTGGGALVISNFTLCADARRGTRPSYDNAKKPDEANRLYEYFCRLLSENGVSRVETGSFGAYMRVSVENDGPISVILDTDKIMAKP